MSKKLVKAETDITDVSSMSSKDYFEAVNNIKTVLGEKRKAQQRKETPIQHIGKLPMGGKLTPYVKSPYMLDEWKKYCNELFGIRIIKTKEHDYGVGSDGLPEKWIEVVVEGTDRSTGNYMGGVGRARIRFNKEGNIVNARHDEEAAYTFAQKSVAKGFGIGADIYHRDVEELSEETQIRVSLTVEDVQQVLGSSAVENLLKRLEGKSEAKVLEILDQANEAVKKKTNPVIVEEAKISDSENESKAEVKTEAKVNNIFKKKENP